MAERRQLRIPHFRGDSLLRRDCSRTVPPLRREKEPCCLCRSEADVRQHTPGYLTQALRRLDLASFSVAAEAPHRGSKPCRALRSQQAVCAGRRRARTRPLLAAVIAKALGFFAQADRRPEPIARSPAAGIAGTRFEPTSGAP